VLLPLKFTTQGYVHTSIEPLIRLLTLELSSNTSRWAWQNSHITLHIPPESRIQHATQKKRSGQPKRPRHTVTSLLSNLHLLLRVPSFSRWPLELRFFSEDVYKAWLKWTEVTFEQVRDSITIIKDFPSTEPLLSGDESSPRSKKQKTTRGIRALGIDYTSQKPHVEKAKNIVDFEQEGSCVVCQSDLEHDSGIYAICPTPGCEAVSHMVCLSKHFLEGEEDSLLPIKGKCPSCKTELRWIDIAKESSLRLRGQKEVEKLLKGKRVRKTKATPSQATVELSDQDEDEDLDIEKEIEQLNELNPGGKGMDLGDTWHEHDDSEDSDTGSIVSNVSIAKKGGSSYQASKAAGLPMVIEDSDWDDAEVLD
jgi:structure-specific endonuclease subunit SLX1